LAAKAADTALDGPTAAKPRGARQLKLYTEAVREIMSKTSQGLIASSAACLAARFDARSGRRPGQ